MYRVISNTYNTDDSKRIDERTITSDINSKYYAKVQAIQYVGEKLLHNYGAVASAYHDEFKISTESTVEYVTIVKVS